jgi:hypothetical protein
MIFGCDCDWFARLFILDTNVCDHHKDGAKENSKILNAYFFASKYAKGTLHCTVCFGECSMRKNGVYFPGMF